MNKINKQKLNKSLSGFILIAIIMNVSLSSGAGQFYLQTTSISFSEEYAQSEADYEVGIAYHWSAGTEINSPVCDDLWIPSQSVQVNCYYYIELDRSDNYFYLTSSIVGFIENVVDGNPYYGNMIQSIHLRDKTTNTFLNDFYENADIDKYGEGNGYAEEIITYVIGVLDPTNLNGYVLERIASTGSHIEEKSDELEFGFLSPDTEVNSGSAERGFRTLFSIPSNQLNKNHDYQILVHWIVYVSHSLLLPNQYDAKVIHIEDTINLSFEPQPPLPPPPCTGRFCYENIQI